MAARKAPSRPRTTSTRKRKKSPPARKRSTRSARTPRRPSPRRAKAVKRPIRRAKATKRPIRRAKAAPKAARRKTVPSKKLAARARRTGTRRTKATPRSKGGAAVRPARPAPPRVAAKPTRVKTPVARRSAPKPSSAPVRAATPPALVRQRRQLADLERDDVMAPSGGGDDRLMASARSGREELKELLAQHNETSPVLTAGDVDAKWTDAYAVGDEAPGGDNPTPDQDRVDDIGKALGVVYDDNEELRGSEKITDRDRHRWELDPASSDDWPHGRE